MAIAAGWTAEPMPADEADDLFRPYAWRQVVRGAVSINGSCYADGALDRADLHGRRVRVGYDIHDPSRVWVRDDRDRLVCVAALDSGTDYFPQSALERARKRREAGQLRRLEPFPCQRKPPGTKSA